MGQTDQGGAPKAGSVSEARYCQTKVISFAGHPLVRTYQREVHHDTLGQ